MPATHVSAVMNVSAWRICSGSAPGGVVAQELVAHLRAGVAHEGDLGVAQVALRRRLKTAGRRA